MDDHLTRVAEAVRDATLKGARLFGTRSGIENTIDIHAIIASVPRPEPVAEVAETSDRYFKCDVLVGCMPDVGTQLYAEPVAAQLAIPDGWKLAPVEPTREMLDAAHTNFRRDVEIDPLLKTSYRAMLAAAPEAPQTIQCNACDWIGSSADALYLGGREPIGPLCPECHETTGPADDAATLKAPEPVLNRPASIGGTTFGVGIPVRTLVAAAQRRYEVEQTPASQAERQALIDALRRPVVDAEIATLREQNAALVAALQAFVSFADGRRAELGELSPEMSDVVASALAALASAKGGAA